MTMNGADEEEAAEWEVSLDAGAYPDLGSIPDDERRRVWCLHYLLEAGKAAATMPTLIKDCKELERFLRGEGGPGLKVVQ